MKKLGSVEYSASMRSRWECISAAPGVWHVCVYKLFQSLRISHEPGLSCVCKLLCESGAQLEHLDCQFTIRLVCEVSMLIVKASVSRPSVSSCGAQNEAACHFVQKMMSHSFICLHFLGYFLSK